MRDQGVFSQSDVEEHLESIRANIEKNIESNRPYAMLLMEMYRGKGKTNDSEEFISLTEIARLITLRIQVMLFKAGLGIETHLKFFFNGKRKTIALFKFWVINKLKENYQTLRLR